MENNQEHKIDKIFKKSLENQPFRPPSDAWMGIHTYTIGQEESKKKVWLRYTSLALLVLLFSGLGLWYYVRLNLDSSDLRISGLKTGNKISKSTNHVDSKSNVFDSKISKLKSSKKNLKPVNQYGATFNDSDSRNDYLEIPLIISDEKIRKSFNLTNPNSDKIVVVLNPDSVENFAYSNDNIIPITSEKQIENIKSKPLILNDLTEKMQKEFEKKIVILEENIVDKKEVYKADSVVYGKKFSLKHPILNFRLGLFNSSVSINANEGGTNPFNSDVISPNSIYAFSGIIGIAWKLNNKSRISLNSKFVSYSAINAQSKSGAAYVDPLSPINKPTGTFNYNASKDLYEYLTPFGYVTQPIDPKSSATPKDFDVWLLGRFSVWQIGANYEHDLIAFRHKKGGIPAMEIYGLVGLNIQKIRKYSSNYTLFENYDPQMNNYNFIRNYTNLTSTNLENGSSIIFGYNTGLGIRFQLSKGFGLNISGNYETNINSWVKDLPFTTRLSVLSVEGGFFVNL